MLTTWKLLQRGSSRASHTQESFNTSILRNMWQLMCTSTSFWPILLSMDTQGLMKGQRSGTCWMGSRQTSWILSKRESFLMRSSGMILMPVWVCLRTLSSKPEIRAAKPLIYHPWSKTMSSTPSILYVLEDRLKTATIPRKNTVVFLMSRKIILGSCARTGT